MVWAGGVGDEGMLPRAGGCGADARASGGARMLVGLRVEGEKVPVAGTGIFEGAAQVGMVTSSCRSPMLGNAVVGMGYVKKSLRRWGRRWRRWAEGGRVKAQVGGVAAVGEGGVTSHRETRGRGDSELIIDN